MFFVKNIQYAAVAHLVERHLAKVEVASSSLVGRSNTKPSLMQKCRNDGFFTLSELELSTRTTEGKIAMDTSGNHPAFHLRF